MKEDIKQKRSKNTYPIYMDNELVEKINKWKLQVERHFNGIIKVTYSDICEIILKKQDSILDEEVIKSMENKKLDTVKRIKLLLEKAIELEKEGRASDLEQLIKENNNLLGLKSSKKVGRKKKMKNQSEDEKSLSNI